MSATWPPHIVIHTLGALTALLLGIVQLAAPKGTFFGALVVAGLFTLLPHRRLGQLLWSAPGLAG